MDIETKDDREKFHPATDDPHLKQTICPFMRSAFKSGLIKVDSTYKADIMQLENIAGNFGKKVLGFFARQNHAVDANGELLDTCSNDSIKDFFKLNRKSLYFNPVMLAGSKGDHPGDTGILSTSGFDSWRFELLVAHSKNGETMNSIEFGRAIATLQPLDTALKGIWPRLFNKSKSAGEWALMIILLGTTHTGKGAQVPIDDLQALFKDNIFPHDWQNRIQSNAGRHPWFHWARRTLIIFILALLSRPGDVFINKDS